MNGPRPTTTGRRCPSARVVAVGACAAAVATLGVGSAVATPDTSVTVTQRTFRIADGDNGLLYLVNKSRAALCTAERLAFEQALADWLDDGAVGEPPVEPASSQEGVEDVRVSIRVVNGRQVLETLGEDLPVEAWRIDSEEGGIDCTATDGFGAALFASGPMDLSDTRKLADGRVTSDTKAKGVIVDTGGMRWNAEVHYIGKLVNGSFTLKGGGRLVPLG